MRRVSENQRMSHASSRPVMIWIEDVGPLRFQNADSGVQKRINWEKITALGRLGNAPSQRFQLHVVYGCLTDSIRLQDRLLYLPLCLVSVSIFANFGRCKSLMQGNSSGGESTMPGDIQQGH